MLNIRAVAQRASIVLLAMSMSACLMSSGSGSGWTGGQPGPAQSDGVSVAITSPTSASTMDTTDSAVDLGGTASAEAGLSRVTWQNDRGGSGVANGTESWTASDVALELGQNTITVTAEDSSGSMTGRNIVINRESGENGSTTLSWNAPTLRIDGTPLTNLAGYRIHFGRMSGIYDYEIDIDNPGVLTYVVEDLVSGDWYFALSAYDAEGMESETSSEVRRHVS